MVFQKKIFWNKLRFILSKINEEIKNNLILIHKKEKISINSFEVYSKIISIIKGYLKSYQFYSNGISLEYIKIYEENYLYLMKNKEMKFIIISYYMNNG